MKKLVYILSIFVAILLLNSCNKEIVNKCDDKDPFAIEENSQTRGANGNLKGGGIIDPDEDDDDMDEDDDTIIDLDEDDDDMDEDDDSIESRENGNQGV